MTSLDIVIPTYQRGALLLETIHYLQQQTILAQRLIIVDQTDYHNDDPVAVQLQQWHTEQKINWLRLNKPSIPNAMNQGLLASQSDYVLFLDDDIIPVKTLIEAHLQQLKHKHVVATVGQILQPEQQAEPALHEHYGKGFSADLQFPFNSTKVRSIRNCMAGNLVVNRLAAIACGGFDSNFVGVAYRFETEFCRRLLTHSGQQCWFVPDAGIHHLKALQGGTRSYVANFLTSARPDHSIGEYYFVLRQASGLEKVRYSAQRLISSIAARFYLRQPWWIPVRLVGELRGLLGAIMLIIKGPKLLSQ